MSWRVYLIHFAASRAMREALGSRRWSAEQKMGVVGLTPLFALCVVTLEVVWNLTGRGRRIRHALGYDVIVVLPGNRGMPRVFREQVDAWRERVKPVPPPAP